MNTSMLVPLVPPRQPIYNPFYTLLSTPLITAFSVGVCVLAPLISAANVVSLVPQFACIVGVAYQPDTSFVRKCSLSILLFFEKKTKTAEIVYLT